MADMHHAHVAAADNRAAVGVRAADQRAAAVNARECATARNEPGIATATRAALHVVADCHRTHVDAAVKLAADAARTVTAADERAADVNATHDSEVAIG